MENRETIYKIKETESFVGFFWGKIDTIYTRSQLVEDQKDHKLSVLGMKEYPSLLLLHTIKGCWQKFIPIKLKTHMHYQILWKTQIIKAHSRNR